MKRKGIAAGIAIAVFYVLVAQLSFKGGLVPTRPLYDGTGPLPPYRWVNPPPALGHSNTPPASATASTTLASLKTSGFNVNTDDAQASVIFPPGGVVPVAGQTGFKIVVKPLDPTTVASPPAGYDFDGNAYSVVGTYIPSGKPIQIPKAVCDLNNANACATVVLRYAFSATKFFRWDGKTWTEVKSQTAGAALQIYGITDSFGTFVAVDPHSAGGPKAKSQTGNIIAFVIGLAAILLGTLVARLRASRKRRAREAAREKKGGKQAQSKPRKTSKAEKQRRKDEADDKPWWRN